MHLLPSLNPQQHSLDFVPDRIARLSQILYERCSGNAELVTDLIREATHQNLGEAAKPTGLVRNLSHFIVAVTPLRHL